MKNLVYLVCFLLYVLPTNVLGISHEESYAEALNIPVADLRRCLSKVNTDMETIMELGETITLNDTNTITPEVVKKVGCFGACLYKTIGAMVNSKLSVEKLMEVTTRDFHYTPEEQNFLRSTFQTCSSQVASKTDECEITIEFSRCTLAILRTRRRTNV